MKRMRKHSTEAGVMEVRCRAVTVCCHLYKEGRGGRNNRRDDRVKENPSHRFRVPETRNIRQELVLIVFGVKTSKSKSPLFFSSLQ